MCNEVQRKFDLDALVEGLKQARITLDFPEGLPNLAPLDSIRITDPTVIIRSVRGEPMRSELVTRRWSWPGQNGKPVYNYRSEGRDFRNSAKQGRCLIPVSGFYEFTPPADPKQKRKDKWLFRWKDADWFTIAGLWKTDETIGEAFTMLTCAPGPDIAPYHDRQVVLLPRGRWVGWLDGSVPASDLLRPTAHNILEIRQTA